MKLIYKNSSRAILCRSCVGPVPICVVLCRSMLTGADWSVLFSDFFTLPFFTASATVTVPFFSLTVSSVKRTEPIIFIIRFLVFDREPYRTKMRTVVRLLLRNANRTKWGTVIRFLLWTANRTAPKLVRCGSRCRNKICSVFR